MPLILRSCAILSIEALTMNTTDLANCIQHTLDSHPVDLAYLFGSHARGTADAESDVDVAVLASPDLSRDARRCLRMDITMALTKALGMDAKVDVIVLQDVPVLLQYNVIRGGQPVFGPDRAVRAAFECDVERRYDDESPFLEREAKQTIQSILAHHS